MLFGKIIKDGHLTALHMHSTKTRFVLPSTPILIIKISGRGIKISVDKGLEIVNNNFYTYPFLHNLSILKKANL